jgi:hypothetical protein
MPVTVVNEGPQGSTVISEDTDSPRRFSWSAAFAGAFVATAVTLFLMTLGSGVGLSLVSVRHATAGGTTTFFTLGAIYFLAAQAFGFAAGGHIVGRLIGPALETDREEEFRAGTHGLVAWALAVVATATLVALSVLVAGSAGANGAINGALASGTTNGARGGDTANVATAYWVDTLFRGPDASVQASLAWRQYAQNDTGTATDAAPAPAPTGDPSTITPAESDAMAPTAAPAAHTPNGSTVFLNNAPTGPAITASTPTTGAPTTRSLGADKAEAGRILTVGMANGGHLTSADHTQLARLVSQDTGLSLGDAQRRVTDVEGRIHQDEVTAAETARKAAAYASLWTALALLFGAVIAVAAAISARWEDDREAGILPGTRVEAVRF